jgi:carbon storage regulator CsrA
MLVLTRKTSERIVIGDSVVITVVRVEGHSARIGIEAPPAVSVVRGELLRGGGAASGGDQASGATRPEEPGSDAAAARRD